MDIIHTPQEALEVGADALCPLGLLSRSEIGPDGLNPDSRYVLEAAAFLRQQDQKDVRLIPSGNDRAGYPKAAQDYWRTHYPAINPSDYDRVDGDAPTTRDSADSLSALLTELQVDNALVITAGYHVGRVSRVLGHVSLIKGVVVAEDVLSERSKKDRQAMAAFRRSSGYRRQQIIEGAINSMPWLEPLASRLAHQTRRFTLERRNA